MMRPIGSNPPPTAPRPAPTHSAPPAGHTPRHPRYTAIDRLLGLMLEVVPAMKRTGMAVSLCTDIDAAVEAVRAELRSGSREHDQPAAPGWNVQRDSALETLRSLLCDPDGAVVAGVSDADRMLIAGALDVLTQPVIAGIDPGSGNDMSSTPTLMGDVLSTLGTSYPLEAPTGRPPHKWTEQERADCADAMRKIVNGEVAVPVLRFDGPGALKEAVDAMHKNGYDLKRPIVTGRPTKQDANAEVSMFAGMADAQIAHAVRRLEQNYLRAGLDPPGQAVSLAALRDASRDIGSVLVESVRAVKGMDDLALDVARSFTADDEPQRRAQLQVAVAEAVAKAMAGRTEFHAGFRSGMAVNKMDDADKQLPQYPEAASVCAEAYQVVGSLLSDLGQFDTQRGAKILDNLSSHRLVHTDVLPWPRFASPATVQDRLTDLSMLAGSWIVEAAGPAADAQNHCATQLLEAIEKMGASSVLAEPVAAAPTDSHALKNFHRALCTRFGYVHDEVHWSRDQVSLEEHIAKQVAPQEAAAYGWAWIDGNQTHFTRDRRRAEFLIDADDYPVTALYAAPEAWRINLAKLASMWKLTKPLPYTTAKQAFIMCASSLRNVLAGGGAMDTVSPGYVLLQAADAECLVRHVERRLNGGATVGCRLAARRVRALLQDAAAGAKVNS